MEPTITVVYGLMKSGNHTFIQWYIENLIRKYFTDEIIKKNGLKYMLDVSIGTVISFYNDIGNFNPYSLKNSKEIILSIEDKFKHVSINDTVRESGPHFKRIFVFRDPRNVWASQKFAKERIKLSHRFLDLDSVLLLYKEMYEAYKQYEDSSILINYDEFILNEDTQKRLAKELGFEIKYNFKETKRLNGEPGRTSFGPIEDIKEFNERWKRLEYSELEKIETYAKIHGFSHFIRPLEKRNFV